MKKKLDAEAARLAPPPPRQQVTDEKMVEASDCGMVFSTLKTG